MTEVSTTTKIWLDEEGYAYECSRTGLVYSVGERKFVVSYINGTMCINPLDAPIAAEIFDAYALAKLVEDQGQFEDVATFENGQYTLNMQ